MDVVTGGSGFIGSHLTEALLALGRKVRVLDIQPWKYVPHPNLEVIECDIRGPLPSFFGVERVFHLAALADIVPSIENPIAYYDTNVTGTLNVLEAAKKYGIKRFVYAASASCYGDKPLYECDITGAVLPSKETSPAAPQYPYALTKYMGEQLVMHWSKVYGINALSLRLFNVYGPRSRSRGAYGAMFGVFLAQIANMKPVTVVGDGTQTRDFTFVSDVVDAFIKAGDCKSYEYSYTDDSVDARIERDCLGGRIYNVGSGVPVSVNRIVELLGSPDRVSLPKRPGEPNITCADISKIKRELGWQPKVGVEEGVKVMLEHLSDYKDAPLWDEASIAKATQTWMEHLS